jgi:acyltransferase-like protein
VSVTRPIVAQTFGRALAAWVTRLRRRGRIRVVGHKRFLQAASGGRTLILTNHPSLLAETFLLGALAAPLYLRDSRRALWTMPDARLLDSWGMPEWLRDDLHCIVADRRSAVKNGRAFQKAMAVLEAGGTIVAHPEEGRTFGAANKHRTTLKGDGAREMQKIERSQLVTLAARTGAEILPGWVDVPHAREALSLGACIRRLVTTDDVITFSFRQPPYRVRAEFDLAEENAILQEKIFAA